MFEKLNDELKKKFKKMLEVFERLKSLA